MGCGCGMPVSRWTSGAAVSLLAALLLLPPNYYLPEEFPLQTESSLSVQTASLDPPSLYKDSYYAHFTTVDFALTLMLILIACVIYLCEWIQRKLMERRIYKLNEWLVASAERLSAWDAQQQQVETTLRLVAGASAEYAVLLFLLLRRHREPPPSARAPDNDGLHFLKPNFDELMI